jgi:hypothetical protein
VKTSERSGGMPRRRVCLGRRLHRGSQETRRDLGSSTLATNFSRRALANTVAMYIRKANSASSASNPSNSPQTSNSFPRTPAQLLGREFSPDLCFKQLYPTPADARVHCSHPQAAAKSSSSCRNGGGGRARGMVPRTARISSASVVMDFTRIRPWQRGQVMMSMAKTRRNSQAHG